MNQLEKGNEIEILGPIPTFEYISNSYQTLLLICCGTGITPIFQIINKILYDPKDTTKLLLFFANRTEEDILLKDELTQLGNSFPNRLKMFFILSQVTILIPSIFFFSYLVFFSFFFFCF